MSEVTLSAPITVIDQSIDRILFRAPTGKDLIGLPEPDADKLGWSIALADRVATNVPPGTVLRLPAFDAIACGQAVAESMVPTMPGSSTAISSAPAGGATPGS